MPAFVYKWLKGTSATGHMRAADEPNQRVQDGPTRQWLCVECEGLLSKSERGFAAELFHPLIQKPSGRYHYGSWLLKFCVSLSWRNLLLRSEKFDPTEMTREFLSEVEAALQAWANFLLDEAPHPGRFEQHLFPLYELDIQALKDLPANFSRYCLRAVSMNVLSAGDAGVSICKLGPFVVVGFIKVADRNRWRDTKVHVKNGIIELAANELPGEVLDYLKDGARKFGEAHERMSTPPYRPSAFQLPCQPNRPNARRTAVAVQPPAFPLLVNTP